jgi:hypothetical protein
MEYDNTNRGALFPNDKMRVGKRDPDLRGSINIDGTEYWFDAWTVYNEDDSVRVIQCKIGDERQAKEVTQQPATKKTAPRRGAQEETPKSKRR